jgi:phage protein U
MNSAMMMTLGFFVFSLTTAAYQDFKRQSAWRHPANSRVGLIPARQFIGKGDDTINLDGLLVPELVGDLLSLDALRSMADTGKAWPLIEGTGKIYGLYVIESLSEGKTLFFRDGAPRRTEFQLTLQRVDDNRLEMLGNPLSATDNLLRR